MSPSIGVANTFLFESPHCFDRLSIGKPAVGLLRAAGSLTVEANSCPKGAPANG